MTSAIFLFRTWRLQFGVHVAAAVADRPLSSSSLSCRLLRHSADLRRLAWCFLIDSYQIDGFLVLREFRLQLLQSLVRSREVFTHRGDKFLGRRPSCSGFSALGVVIQSLRLKPGACSWRLLDLIAPLLLPVTEDCSSFLGPPVRSKTAGSATDVFTRFLQFLSGFSVCANRLNVTTPPRTLTQMAGNEKARHRRNQRHSGFHRPWLRSAHREQGL